MNSKKTTIKFYSSEDHEREIELEWGDEELSYRKPFWRDYARLLHSPSFRRLKGKTQLFPGIESDFYRNRLTHSLEVAQIGKSIANFLNWQLNKIYLEKGYDIDNQLSFIDTDLVEFSCHAHDLGHPPFGHQGEEALDEKMKEYGGFEGNAQTLRILTRLEKKELPTCYNSFEKDDTLSTDIFNHTIFDEDGNDLRVGLNLTNRSLASILKYDNVIKEKAKRTSVEKGYYRSEKIIIDKLKRSFPKNYLKGKKFKTIECQIMDIADDIAYSIYDMEDAFKGEFLHPIELYSMSLDDKELLDKIRSKIKKRGEFEKKSHLEKISIFEIESIIEDIFYRIFQINNDDDKEQDVNISFRIKNKLSIAIAKDGYYRTGFMTDLATSFIRSIQIDLNEDFPAISNIIIDPEIEKKIEVLKHLTYEYQIKSPKLKAVEYKGKNIISKIFDTLSDEGGEEFLPKDVKRIYLQAKKFDDKVWMRVICDFISGMTDSYAIEFYNRLFSTNIVSIHRPYN